MKCTYQLKVEALEALEALLNRVNERAEQYGKVAEEKPALAAEVVRMEAQAAQIRQAIAKLHNLK